MPGISTSVQKIRDDKMTPHVADIAQIDKDNKLLARNAKERSGRAAVVPGGKAIRRPTPCGSGFRRVG